MGEPLSLGVTRGGGVDQQYVSGTGFSHSSYRAFSFALTSLVDLICSRSSCCFQFSSPLPLASDAS